MGATNGLSPNNDLSYLQTPTYQIVTVFIIFIFVSLMIEKILHRVRERIDRSGSKGMMHAFQAVLNELVLLGFLSFMLEIFGPEISKICIDMYAPGSVSYWFARCPIKYVGDPSVNRPSPASAEWLSTNSVLGLQSSTYPAAGIVKQNCSYDEQPFASERSLHAIHYLLFLIGISRIFAIISLVYASHTKLALWDDDLRRLKMVRTLEGISDTRRRDGGTPLESSEEPTQHGKDRRRGHGRAAQTMSRERGESRRQSGFLKPTRHGSHMLDASGAFDDAGVRELNEIEEEEQKTSIDTNAIVAHIVAQENEAGAIAPAGEQHHDAPSRGVSRSVSAASSIHSSPNSVASSPRSSSLGRSVTALRGPHTRRDSAPSSRRGSATSSHVSSDDVASEQEQSWMRISGVQVRRMSHGHDGLKRHVDRISWSSAHGSTMLQAAREVSILAKKAEAAARKAAEEEEEEEEEEENDVEKPRESAHNTVEGPIVDFRATDAADMLAPEAELSSRKEVKHTRRTVSTIMEDAPRMSDLGLDSSTKMQENSSSQTRDNPELSPSDRSDDASASARQSAKERERKMNAGRGVRRWWLAWFPILDVAHHKLVRSKTQVFMEQLVTERMESQRVGRKRKAFIADAMRRRSEADLTSAETSAKNPQRESLSQLIASSVCSVFYVLQLQTLLFMRQFTHGVTRGDVDEARKSFIRKHALPCDFEFLQYTQFSVDEDLAEVIQVHWIEWVVGMLYLFGVGVDDYFAFQFFSPLLALLLISLVGLQIQNVMFLVAALRIDDQHTTDSHFWFGAPRNMLWMLRISTSIFSFTLAFTYFVVWKEGLGSCYFDLWHMNWGWVVYNSVLTFAGTAYIGFILMPQYSLAVEMGSQYRKDVLRQLIAANKVKKSEDEAEQELDERQLRSDTSATYAEERFLMGRSQLSMSAASEDILRDMIEGTGTGVMRRTMPAGIVRSASSPTSASRVEAKEWVRQAAAAEIQKKWRLSRLRLRSTAADAQEDGVQ